MNNKKAYHEYTIIEEFTAGIILHGPEVKSIREKKANLSDSYCIFIEGDLYIKNFHIDQYKNTNEIQEPKRDRKLLLNKKELEKISTKLNDVGLTIIPLSVISGKLIKIKIGIAKGKKLYDKRKSEKEKEIKKDLRKIDE